MHHPLPKPTYIEANDKIKIDLEIIKIDDFIKFDVGRQRDHDHRRGRITVLVMLV